MDTIGVYTPDNFFAGTYPISKEVAPVAAGEEIPRFAPVKINAGELELVAAEGDIADVYGISAESGNGDDGDAIVVYLTGEFFESALVLEDDVTLELLKPALRNIGIFLKEVTK